eukprot:13828872-Heterocapsa_arctica.AAC.1
MPPLRRRPEPIHLSVLLLPGFLEGTLKSYITQEIIFPGVQESVTVISGRAPRRRPASCVRSWRSSSC